MFHRLLLKARLGQNFSRDQSGSVAVTAALTLPVLLGVAGLAIEYGDALVTRAQTQRVADLAVHAALLAYNQSGNTDAMTQAAVAMAELNGVAADETQVTLDADAAAGPVVRVTITTPRPLLLAQLISAEQSVDVTVRAAAMLEQVPSSCIQALDPSGSGITLSGGASITAPGCAVSSNAQVTASGSGGILTETLTYDSDTPPQFSGSAGVTAPDGGEARIIRTSAPDPLADHAGIALARARLVTAAAMSAPVMPTVTTGPDIDFGWNPTATQQQATAVGCTATFSGSTWTFSCPSGGNVHLGNLTIGGGLNLDFGLTGTAATTYTFSGAIANTGTTMRFGPGNYDIAHGITTGGGTTTTFGAGTYRIGRSTTSCNGLTGFSICNTSTLTIAGPSLFELAGGVQNAGGATLVLGTGLGNRFRFGPSTNGDALRLDGSSITTLGDATGSGDRFQIIGDVVTRGYSCLEIGAATNHDFEGALRIEGSVIFGAGLYAIDGYLHLGASGGGGVTCFGQSVSMRALDATFVISGERVQTFNQNCSGYAAFCATAGYNSMRLVAPTTGPFAGLAMIGPGASGVTAGAAFGGGAYGSQISGAFYYPNGPITLSGGADAGGVAGEACLQIIGATITMSGGTTAASECLMDTTGGMVSVRLIE